MMNQQQQQQKHGNTTVVTAAKFCTKCGNGLRDEDRFCGGCGQPVDGSGDSGSDQED
jgi:predicted amidophosphoribosyltransferase